MNKISRRFKIALVLLIIIIVVVIFRQQSNWVEAVYYNGLYQGLCYLLRPAMNLLPFSVGDLFYFILIITLLVGLVQIVRFLFTRRYQRLKQFVLAGVILFEGLWLVFHLFWGLNYYRPAAAQILKLTDTTYTLKDVAKVTANIIDSANACRALLSEADLAQNNPQIYNNAQSAVKAITPDATQFKVVSPKVKSSIFTAALNYMGTSGYYNPFSFEAQLNSTMPVFDKPFTACHEMGHQAGWAREDEANFFGYVAGIKSTDKLLRYSAYYSGIGEFMRYLRRRDTIAHKALKKRISPSVMQDFKTDSAYWTRYAGNAQQLSGMFYDNFLKANNQPRGLYTYNRMILLTMAWYRKEYHVW